MVPTKRLTGLLWLIAVVALAAGFIPSWRPALLVLDAIALVAALLDVGLALGRRVEAERQAAAIFSVGRANPVVITLRNRSGRRLSGVASDDPLDDCDTKDLPARFVLPARGEVTFRYEVHPTRRGPRDFRAVVVRYKSVLGLIARQERIELPAHVDIFPDVHAARALELLRRQGRQDARLGSLRVRGGDTEFERLRPYQRGDEARHIDWRAFARRDDPTVRQYQAESNQNVVFALDVGRGMRGTSKGLTSVDHALNAALLAADVALRGGDKAGMIAFDDAPRTFLRPLGGRAGGRKLTRASYALEAGFAATDYHAAMSFLQTQVRARSLFIIFTNLLDPRSAKELAAAVRSLLPRHLPLCVLMRDRDVEDLATTPADTAHDLYVRAAAAEALAWRDGLIRTLRNAGVLVLDVFPDDVTPELVKSYLEIKTRRLL
ncbi:DUF58 domain-containing protein [Pendulispora albinea]|uniref:DUF58 domain-containing protein n=1 Tax=Pendulispora albinea TaxID=2741071 RepID=A0ABZ2LV18_9BACT